MVSDGLVHMGMMNDDYYFFDEEHFVLVGKEPGKTYHLGWKGNCYIGESV